MTTATTLIVMSCRFRYALAPSCTAAEICRIRSFPADFRMTAAIKKKAKANPMTAHNIDNCTPDSSRFKANKIMSFRNEAHDFMEICSAGKALIAAC